VVEAESVERHRTVVFGLDFGMDAFDIQDDKDANVFVVEIEGVIDVVIEDDNDDDDDEEEEDV